ncbi:TPA: hypothetical protein ACKP3Z_005939 [Pseudomonas aeruginosa]|jgi:hypothetical protein|nr:MULTISPECIES: hypothetical protein [Pseudomonadota]MBA6092698.1 hypothetical protein [Pseudomonas monteilii]MBH9345926.1 hypothetical protein [Pseudomonas aeruginosa]MBH9399916.1 hypothetical protein [Pseudomonas aeruginosa]MBI7349751.1 hypothetical protein [Pseudomonas aeruginosa]MBI7374018.1 hypothetical protein [Pseudomonas aeruginosa]
MDSTVQTTQRKALYAWAWAIWIGFAAWLAYHGLMQETGFDWLLFAFVVVIPKGFRGALYASTAPQNRFSEGYSAKDKRLPLYWVLTLLLFAINLGRTITDLMS